MKYILPLIFLSVLLGNKATYAQYTETINSNHPGQSQGGFSVGTNVLQFEGGLAVGKERHKLLDTKSKAFGMNYAIRYGLYFEALEVNFSGNYLGQNVTENFPNGDVAKYGLSGFPSNTLGLKYLVWDPWKRKKEEKPNLKSWRENHRWKWKYLIPAISAYAGANFVFTKSPYRFENEPAISPKFAVITQSDWKDRWVLVSNIIVDKVTTDFPSYEFLLTLTHTLRNPKWAIFGEYQGIKSDFYSDIIARGGAAYLIHKDFQVEAELMTSFKNTPSKLYLTLGVSYRLDWHKKDEIIRDKDEDLENLNNLQNQGESELEGLDKEIEELNREIEGLDNDNETPKAPPTNRGFESFEDPEDIEELERQKEENRTQYVDEYQQEEQEKQDKVNAKLSKKDAKREAKLQRKLEKEQLKAQKRTDKELSKLDKEEGALDGDEIDGGATPTPAVTPDTKAVIKKPKKKKRIKRRKLSEEEKEKELEDLDKQIRELEIDFESDRKKKKEKKPKKKKEKKPKKKKEKKRTKDVEEALDEL